jgi:hypothetical protein
LSDYIDMEQLFVLPTVRSADTWGRLRADALAHDHQGRRDDLGAIGRAHAGVVDPQLLASDLREFSRSLRAGLESQERGVLGVDGLRDDVVETEPD